LVTLNKENQRPPLLLAQGVCQLELGAYSEALVVFKTLDGKSPTYQSAADFYLGLTYYYLKDYTAATTALEKVPAGTYYFTAAERLRKKI